MRPAGGRVPGAYAPGAFSRFESRAGRFRPEPAGAIRKLRRRPWAPRTIEIEFGSAPPPCRA